MGEFAELFLNWILGFARIYHHLRLLNLFKTVELSDKSLDPQLCWTLLTALLHRSSEHQTRVTIHHQAILVEAISLRGERLTSVCIHEILVVVELFPWRSHISLGTSKSSNSAVWSWSPRTHAKIYRVSGQSAVTWRSPSSSCNSIVQVVSKWVKVNGAAVVTATIPTIPSNRDIAILLIGAGGSEPFLLRCQAPTLRRDVIGYRRSSAMQLASCYGLEKKGGRNHTTCLMSISL